MRRLHPEPADLVNPIDEYARPRRTRHADGRGWLGLCMVASLDGSTVVEGRSGALSCPADTAVLGALRRAADVVLVGAGTVRAEGYGAPKKPGQRIGVVSRTGTGLPYDSPLFADGHAFVVLPESAPPVPVESVRCGTDQIDFAAALRALDATFVQAEGGAALNAALADADLVDELNLTISPNIVGGRGARMTDGASDLASRFDLGHILEEDGFLFTRYVRRR